MKLNIQNKKVELIQWLTTLNDETIIQQLMDLRNSYIKNWWDDLSKAEMASIAKGIRDADNGKLVSHAEARKVYEKYL